MERQIECKRLTAVYEEENIVLRGPIYKKFDVVRKQTFHINIEQSKIRIIEISTDSDGSIFELNSILLKIERLLMLFDGSFFKLQKLIFSNSDIFSSDYLAIRATNLMTQRLTYFSSANLYNNTIHRLINFEDVLTTDLFNKWDELLEELGIVHQMFLYSVSDSKITVDVKCAFMTELAEPIIEIVKERTNDFASLEQGSHVPSLKNCLDALISKYGEEIFNKEITSAYNSFLNALVNSRINIMHIKRNQKSPTFNGEQSALYAQKLSLLYRKILFELLELDSSSYFKTLKYCVQTLDNWNSISDRFIKSLIK